MAITSTITFCHVFTKQQIVMRLLSRDYISVLFLNLSERDLLFKMWHYLSSHPYFLCLIIRTQCLTSLLKHSASHRRSSELYIHGSWKWQLIQLSINLGRYCTRLEWKPHAEETRRGQETRGGGWDRKRGEVGRSSKRLTYNCTDKPGSGKVKRSKRFK